MDTQGNGKRVIASQAGTMALAAGVALTALAYSAQAQAPTGEGCNLLKNPECLNQNRIGCISTNDSLLMRSWMEAM
jgi:hypothetical protein